MSGFHDYLDQIFPRYQASKTKRAKRAIVQQIYDHITTSGNFLEKEEKGARYMIIDENDAKEKIGYAIRYRKKRILKAEADLAKKIEQDDAAHVEAAAAFVAEEKGGGEEAKMRAVPTTVRQLPPSPAATASATGTATLPVANSAVAAVGEISIFIFPTKTWPVCSLEEGDRRTRKSNRNRNNY
mmetsp:Transcript_10984/g.20921  ORF Transcript_10984/g.20921 Transcript_10984/m.20921 type:complete len:184 (+) Transcript_10984:133-684(+)